MSWVLRRGVLAYGVPLCAFFVGMQWGQYHRAIGMILLLNIPIWLLIGSLFGVLTWYAMEVLYSRHR